MQGFVEVTTNAGAAEGARTSIGFTQQDHSSDSMQIITKTFSPEFRNRIDAIIQFKPLDFEIICHVVDKFVFELESQLAAKNVTLALEPEARTWLAEHGCDLQMGARPMKRVIQENIKKPLADELLFGKLSHGGSVRAYVENDKLLFTIESKELALPG
jgi:ATP-dependent Clp protease ATP-binding subunit ClpA